jgi:hypothetical protein
MRSRADHRQDRSLARLARWLGIDRNPLRRGIDRVEAALRLVMILLAVVAVPAAAVAAGRWADHYGLHKAQAQRAANHQVTAVLLEDAPGSPTRTRTFRPPGWRPAGSPRGSRPGPARSSPWPERAREAPCGPGSIRAARSPTRRRITASSSATSGSPSWRPAWCRGWCCWRPGCSSVAGSTAADCAPGRRSGGPVARSGAATAAETSACQPAGMP